MALQQQPTKQGGPHILCSAEHSHMPPPVARTPTHTGSGTGLKVSRKLLSVTSEGGSDSSSRHGSSHYSGGSESHRFPHFRHRYYNRDSSYNSYDSGMEKMASDAIMMADDSDTGNARDATQAAAMQGVAMAHTASMAMQGRRLMSESEPRRSGHGSYSQHGGSVRVFRHHGHNHYYNSYGSDAAAADAMMAEEATEDAINTAVTSQDAAGADNTNGASQRRLQSVNVNGHKKHGEHLSSLRHRFHSSLRSLLSAESVNRHSGSGHPGFRFRGHFRNSNYMGNSYMGSGMAATAGGDAMMSEQTSADTIEAAVAAGGRIEAAALTQ